MTEIGRHTTINYGLIIAGTTKLLNTRPGLNDNYVLTTGEGEIFLAENKHTALAVQNGGGCGSKRYPLLGEFGKKLDAPKIQVVKLKIETTYTITDVIEEAL